MPRVSDEEVARIMAHFETSKAEGTCEHCGFEWGISPAEALDMLRTSPERTRVLIGERWDEAMKQHDPPLWSPSAYIWHMVDAIGIWSERFVAMHHDLETQLVGFDQDFLGEVRSYDRLHPVAGLWAYEKRISDFVEAAELHDPDTGFVHPDFGPWTIGGVIKWMSHDVYHHEEDIRKQLGDPWTLGR